MDYPIIPKICGVATNDLRGMARTKVYAHWAQMIMRCYDKYTQDMHPSCKGCTVCEEWLTFSNFKKWFDDPANGYREGYHLDKDLIVKGNKTYSPDTCCFVPKKINTLLSRGPSKINSDLPKGVSPHFNGGYSVMMSKYGKSVHLGVYRTIELAYAVYKAHRENYIKEVAMYYYMRGEITGKVYNALMRYEVEITD